MKLITETDRWKYWEKEIEKHRKAQLIEEITMIDYEAMEKEVNN